MTHCSPKLLAWALLAATALPAQNTAVTARPRLLWGPRIDVPDLPSAFTTDGEHLWIGHSGLAPGLMKVRSSDNAVVSQFNLRSAATSLCWDGAGLWVADGKFLTRRFGNVTYSYAVPGGYPWSVAFNGEFLYVVAGLEGAAQLVIFRLSDLTGVMAGIDPGLQSPRPVEVIPIGGVTERALPIIVTSKHVYVGTDKGILAVVPLDTPSGAHDHYLISSTPVHAVAFHKGYLVWITAGVRSLQFTWADGLPSSTNPVGILLRQKSVLPFPPTALGSNGSNLIIGYENGQAEVLESSRRFQLGDALTAITFDGTYLWLANRGVRYRWFLNKM